MKKREEALKELIEKIQNSKNLRPEDFYFDVKNQLWELNHQISGDNTKYWLDAFFSQENRDFYIPLAIKYDFWSKTSWPSDDEFAKYKELMLGDLALLKTQLKKISKD